MTGCWQPIESAPRDGTLVLLSRGSESRPCVGRYIVSKQYVNGDLTNEYEGWSVPGDYLSRDSYQLWAPIPALPTE